MCIHEPAAPDTVPPERDTTLPPTSRENTTVLAPRLARNMRLQEMDVPASFETRYESFVRADAGAVAHRLMDSWARVFLVSSRSHVPRAKRELVGASEARGAPSGA